MVLLAWVRELRLIVFVEPRAGGMPIAKAEAKQLSPQPQSRRLSWNLFTL